jgi:5'-nucleotidase
VPRVGSWIASIVVALCACAARQDRPGVRPAGATVTVQLLAINDLHGHLQPPSGSNGRIDTTAAGGAEYLASHLKQTIARHPNSLVVAAGDLVGASPLISSMFHDEPIIEALNAMGMGISSVGNHEFDEGYDEVLRLQRGGCHPVDGCQDGDGFDGARFEYLAANVVRKATGAPLFPAAAIRTIGGVKIGFIGATFAGTSQVVPSSVTRDLAFLDEATAANAQAAALRRQGVHAIVLLIHEGLRQRGENPDPNGCANVSGALAAVAKRLDDDIAVVISGHTHTYYNCRIGGRLVTSASSYGRMITRIIVEIDSATGRIVNASATNQIVTRDVASDPAVAAIVAKYVPLVDRKAAEVVGSVAGDLRAQPNADGESPLGNVIADAQLAATSGHDRGAVVAFMNRGGIRADIVAAAGTSAERPHAVTYNDLHTVQPFGNTLVTLTMTGEMIRRLLEQQFEGAKPDATRLLQVSRGFAYQYSASAPAGNRVIGESIQIDGRRLAPSDPVRVTASDFLVGGGDGFTMFSEGTDRVVGVADIDALVAYFKSRSPVAAPAGGRIVRVD